MRKLFSAMLFSIFSVGTFAQLDGVNLALHKPVTASSASQTPLNAVDGNYSTRWESAFSDNQWITIDLESRYVIDTVLIFWEAVATSANSGTIQGSYDGNYWWNIAELSATDADKVDTLLVNDTTRYVKLKGIHRNGPWGYSPYEIEVYGTEEISGNYLDSISVSPDNSNINFGETIQYTLGGFDQHGNSFSLPTTSWTCSNGGSISSNGLFTANKIGDFKIIVISDKISDTAIVKVTSSQSVPTSVVISPLQDTLKEGETTQFSAVVYDQDGTPMTEDITWSTKFNTISQSGLFTGKYTGDNAVFATVNYTIGNVSGSVSDTAIVSVFPTSTQNIALNYVSAVAGSEQQSADNGVDNNYNTRWESAANASDMSWTLKLDKAYDMGAIVIDWEVAGAQSYDILISNDSASWTTIYQFNPKNLTRSLTNHSFDSLPVNGNAQFVKFVGISRTFTPYGPSFWEFKIYPAANSTVSATRIVVDPKTATINEGESLQLNYTAYNTSDEVIDINASWKVLSGNATITSNGLFSTVRSGEYKVVALFGNISDTATITVEDISVLDSIHVSPKEASIFTGETQQYSATGYDQFGIEMNVTPEWSVSGGGSVSSTGLFSATTEGSFYVKASSENISDSAQITIQDAPELATLEITPADVTIQLGETQQFTATGTDQYGDPIDVSVTWSVSDGASISEAGLFSTSAKGEYTITAEQGEVSASATITVEGDNGAENLSLNSINFYPNPATDYLTIDLGTTSYKQIEIVNVNGAKVYADDISSVSGILTIDLKSIERGMYCVRLINDNKVESLVITKN